MNRRKQEIIRIYSEISVFDKMYHNDKQLLLMNSNSPAL